jgi:phosphonate transport system substrate-binding protein
MLFFASLSAREYVFAMYPSNNPEKIIRALTPLMEYLHEKSGETFRIAITKDYDELKRRIEDGSVDFAWINTKNYVILQEKLPSMRYLATYQEFSKSGRITPYYQAYLVTLNASNITHIKEAKGRSFAFTDKGSTSGYVYAMMMLEKYSIDPYAFFHKVFFLKKHDKVVEALINRSIDVGAMSDGTYYNAKEKYGDIFTILEKSEFIPLDAIVATQNVSLSFSQTITQALVSIPHDAPSNQAFQEHLGWMSAGFTQKDKGFYETFKQALKAHGL